MPYKHEDIVDDWSPALGPGGFFILPDGKVLPVEHCDHFGAAMWWCAEVAPGGDPRGPQDYSEDVMYRLGVVRMSTCAGDTAYLSWKSPSEDALRSLRRQLSHIRDQYAQATLEDYSVRWDEEGTRSFEGFTRIRVEITRRLTKFRQQQQEAA